MLSWADRGTGLDPDPLGGPTHGAATARQWRSRRTFGSAVSVSTEAKKTERSICENPNQKPQNQTTYILEEHALKGGSTDIQNLGGKSAFFPPTSESDLETCKSFRAGFSAISDVLLVCGMVPDSLQRVGGVRGLRKFPNPGQTHRHPPSLICISVDSPFKK